MKIKEAFSNITEGKNPKANDYGCVMIYFKPNDNFTKLLEEINDEDVYTDENDGYGLTPPKEFHVTLLYGLHEDVQDKEVEEVVKGIKSPKIEHNKTTSLFENEYDVLKIDIKPTGLVKYNTLLKKLPHTSTFPDYHPHMTLGYIKKGKGKDYVKKIDNLNIEASHIIYSKTDGTKKRYNFI
jgi:2'-5' RNA ligase